MSSWIMHYYAYIVHISVQVFIHMCINKLKGKDERAEGSDATGIFFSRVLSLNASFDFQHQALTLYIGTDKHELGTCGFAFFSIL